MYAQFAAVYDRLMADQDHPGWARYYLSLAELAGVRPEAACECACGTGLMTVELQRSGVRMTGVDLSPEMLERASVRARAQGLQIPFVRQDMRELTLHKPVDLVLCPCDGVNYLLNDRDLARFFGAAFRCLRPGGVLAFDVSSEHKLRTMCASGPFFEDLDDLTYLWSNQWDERRRTVQMELCFFLRRPDGLYDRFDERQIQRAHALEALRRALEASGFEGVRVYGDRSFDPPRIDEQRLHLTAVRH